MNEIPAPTSVILTYCFTRAPKSGRFGLVLHRCRIVQRFENASGVSKPRVRRIRHCEIQSTGPKCLYFASEMARSLVPCKAFRESGHRLKLT